MPPEPRRLARSTRATPLLLLALAACDRATAATADSGTPTKPASTPSAGSGPKPTAASTEIVLEPAALPGVGTLTMPRGYTSTIDKHWRFDLGNHESIDVSWEPHGAATLDKAKSMSNILATAETITSATTLPSGYHEVERTRASDGFTFIAVFGPDWYVKCVAPAAKMSTCREIVRSKA